MGNGVVVLTGQWRENVGKMYLPDPAPVTMAVLPARETAIALLGMRLQRSVKWGLARFRQCLEDRGGWRRRSNGGGRKEAGGAYLLAALELGWHAASTSTTWLYVGGLDGYERKKSVR